MTEAERGQIRAHVSERVAVIATIWGEARAESLMGKIAVACVIANRVQADLGRDGQPDWWGEGFKAVCLKPWQFSCWWETSRNATLTYGFADDVMGLAPRKDAALLIELGWIADGVMGGAVRDVTAGATHYLTTDLWRSPRAPKWIYGREPVAIVGRHAFFAGVEA